MTCSLKVERNLVALIISRLGSLCAQLVVDCVSLTGDAYADVSAPFCSCSRLLRLPFILLLFLGFSDELTDSSLG